MNHIDQEQQLREYARAKDLFLKKDSKTGLWSVYDQQKGTFAKMVKSGLTFSEAYDIVDQYSW